MRVGSCQGWAETTRWQRLAIGVVVAREPVDLADGSAQLALLQRATELIDHAEDQLPRCAAGGGGA
jgi:hypothetical protein